MKFADNTLSGNSLDNYSETTLVGKAAIGQK